MCEYCHQEYCCLHGHHARHFRGPAWGGFYEEPTPASRKEFLEEERAALERRLKAIESRLQELSK